MRKRNREVNTIWPVKHNMQLDNWVYPHHTPHTTQPLSANELHPEEKAEMFDDNDSMRRETIAKAEVNTQSDLHKQEGRWEKEEACYFCQGERGRAKNKKKERGSSERREKGEREGC